MYILNTSFMVEHDIHDRWLDGFRNRFLPHLRQSGFAEPLFTRVVSNETESHFTYSVQIPMPDLSRYREFTEQVMGEYASACSPIFGEKVLWFISLLKKMDLQSVDYGSPAVAEQVSLSEGNF